MPTKLQQFKIRNQKRNAHLYADGLIVGYDYVVCPVSGERLSMIKKNYVEKILGLTEDQYPIVQRICHKRKENIKSGLATIDLVSGLSKYQIGQQKAQALLSDIDPITGKSGYKKKGEKTRATHMSRVDNLGRSGYRRQADARLNTLLPNGLTVEQNAHKKRNEALVKKGITRSVGASKVSKKKLASLLSYLNENHIKYYFDQSEYGIMDPDTNSYYYYDLTIPDFKIAIEYQSSAWHANPSWEGDKWNNWRPPKGKTRRPEEVLQYDYKKAKVLHKHRGIVTYYVWEDSVIDDVERLLCLVKTQSTKY